MKFFFLLFCVLLFLTKISAQKINQEYLNEISNKYAKNSFSMLKELLSIPNDANYPNDLQKNLTWCEQAFQKRNFSTLRLETENVPILLAERRIKNAKKTVLIYLQVDGQPVDTSRWSQKNPYKPILKKQSKQGNWEEVSWEQIENYNDDWRVFARSASDAKGPIAMFLSALDAIGEEKINPNFNIKVIMDFEEELGSPRLAKAVSKNSKLLESDMLIIFDGPMHNTNKSTLLFGARGAATITITTFGPITAQHSGHFGNYAPNPALRLSKLLASMIDEDGRVVIPNFYSGISLNAKTKKILQSVPDDEDEIRDRLQLGSVDKVGENYQEAMQYPSLNIRGMQSGWIDKQARTIVPAWARAEIDIRLVLESDPEHLISSIKRHIENQGYFVTDKEPTKQERMNNKKIVSFTHKTLYQSFRTEFNSEPGIWLQNALKNAFGYDPIMIRLSGGSIPISPFVLELNIPAVIVPTVNHDNNQHSPNENLRLGNYRDGIKTMIAILTENL